MIFDHWRLPMKHNYGRHVNSRGIKRMQMPSYWFKKLN